MSAQHCESYDVKRETVHCYPVNSSLLTAVARDCWNLSAVFKFCFCFVLLYNKSLNDWSLGEQWILFPLNLNVSLDFVSGNIEILGKQNSQFPSGPVIKCLILFSFVSLIKVFFNKPTRPRWGLNISLKKLKTPIGAFQDQCKQTMINRANSKSS